jgi:hypothetical protein
MNRNNVTTVDKLVIGDRFYRCNDKHKEVLELVEMPAKRTYYRTYRHFFITASTLENIRNDAERIKRMAKPINGTTAVVFLRNSQTVSHA